MIFAFRRPCADHRPALLAFVDRQAPTGATAPALAHLDRCRTCEAELTEVALTITALRRLHAEVEGIEPPPDAWPRLRARIEHPTPRRLPIMSPLAGVGMSLALVAAVVGLSPGMPLRATGPVDVQAAEAAREARAVMDRAGAEEAAWLRERVREGRRPARASVARPADVSVARLGPDGIARAADRPSSGRSMVWV